MDTGLLTPVWAATASSFDDRAWLAAMLDVEVALARAQSRLGVVPAPAAQAIASAADPDAFDLSALAVAARDAANPVVPLVKALTDRVAPAAAEYVHRGATSQDVLDSAAMLLATRAVATAGADLTRTADALAELTARHAGTLMAGRTLTQHAVPVTFGLKAAGWLMLALDARDRLRALRLPAQLGGAAGTLASYVEYAGRDPAHGPALLAAFAAELGLAEPVVPWHTVRTPVADLAAATSFTVAALGKIALDVQVLSRTEIAEVAEPAAAGRGASSAMPHKRNPALATMIVAAARQVPAHATVLLGSVLAEDERPAGAWQAEWHPLRESLRLTTGAAATAVRLLSGLEVFPDRMRANLTLTGGAVLAERLAAALTPGLGRAAAKQLVARASATPGVSFAQALAAELTSVEVDLPALLDPTGYLGATPELIARALARHPARVEP
ncbi:3-carboxy-cis,cis-muconate cycloisomerase [Actinophytocola xinjiangensis]|uniref:3-carboxy-cis,cis-muconate cycloisomerase n=1 Tax=Actinophytocola xinjiangensis TaxID=485602 RepID=A0A7Z1AVN9_9PSEU|nr:lyase family protein [Actinophytocola xinjiangensis]OLF06651.1 3-carboxy-cis,cis-muconate cycloisomerase [Actinophytocola xinjiangensis]